MNLFWNRPFGGDLEFSAITSSGEFMCSNFVTMRAELVFMWPKQEIFSRIRLLRPAIYSGTTIPRSLPYAIIHPMRFTQAHQVHIATMPRKPIQISGYHLCCYWGPSWSLAVVHDTTLPSRGLTDKRSLFTVHFPSQWPRNTCMTIQGHLEVKWKYVVPIAFEQVYEARRSSTTSSSASYAPIAQQAPQKWSHQKIWSHQSF